MHLRLVAPATLAAFAIALPASAPAVVPPKNCGTVKVKGKRYTVKADQMRCTTARRYSTNYLISRKRKPRGYRCERYGRETKLVFRCVKGRANFFAIRR
jgi:hypothetical protein